MDTTNESPHLLLLIVEQTFLLIQIYKKIALERNDRKSRNQFYTLLM